MYLYRRRSAAQPTRDPGLAKPAVRRAEGQMLFEPHWAQSALKNRAPFFATGVSTDHKKRYKNIYFEYAE